MCFTGPFMIDDLHHPPPSEPLDSSNSQFCPLCGCLWRNPPSFCSGFLRFVTPLPNPLLLKRSAEEEELSEIKTNEISFDTTPPAVEIMFCPFHDFRDPLQFYGSYTLVVTSLWFFTWQSGNPLADFRLFLFLYSILIYLPFLYFWFQCSRKVEYETESTSDEDIHLSHNARRERTARFILKLSHLAEEEILAVGQLLPLPAKKETGMYISQLLKGQFGVLSFVCLFFFWIFIPLQLGGLVWLMPVFGLLPWTYFTLSLFCESEKRFIIPIACSSSQCLIFIHILFDSIEVVSMSQVELSDKLFLVGFPSPDKVQLRPCTKIGDWELASGGGGGVGVLNWKKNEYKKKVQPSIHLFPSVPLITSTFYVQFQDDEIVKKFRDSWFGFSPECKNLPQKGSTWFGLGFGSITLLIFFGLVLFNWLGSFPSIPLLIFFFFGILGTWIIFILERFGDDDLPVWTHLASPCEVV